MGHSGQPLFFSFWDIQGDVKGLVGTEQGVDEGEISGAQARRVPQQQTAETRVVLAGGMGEPAGVSLIPLPMGRTEPPHPARSSTRPLLSEEYQFRLGLEGQFITGRHGAVGIGDSVRKVHIGIEGNSASSVQGGSQRRAVFRQYSVLSKESIRQRGGIRPAGRTTAVNGPPPRNGGQKQFQRALIRIETLPFPEKLRKCVVDTLLDILRIPQMSGGKTGIALHRRRHARLRVPGQMFRQSLIIFPEKASPASFRYCLRSRRTQMSLLGVYGRITSAFHSSERRLPIFHS